MDGYTTQYERKLYEFAFDSLFLKDFSLSDIH